jgi:triacylglycerol lipase
MMGKTIVLAHGVLGFGAVPVLSMFVNYFNGVAAHLRGQGHQVSAPSVAPLGSVVQRGTQLASAILTSKTKDVHIIAHSMGGLDARYALTRMPGVAGHVATLVTIGTPHRGSPVADALARRGSALMGHVPSWIANQLRGGTAALLDLTTAVGEKFDAATADKPGVRYIEAAGDASRGGHHILSKLSDAIAQKTSQINDGFVTKSSALRTGHEHLEDWPVDHFGEVGWPLPTAAHLARYDAIVEML